MEVERCECICDPLAGPVIRSVRSTWRDRARRLTNTESPDAVGRLSRSCNRIEGIQAARQRRSRKRKADWTALHAARKPEAMAADELDRLLTTLAVRLHACSVCQIQHGWGLSYSAFDAITIHFVLAGQGALRVGTGPVLPFAVRNALVVPAHQPHVLGGLGAGVQLVRADEHCSMLGDGLVAFTAGDGSRDVLMLCGMISASHNSALGLFDLLREPLIQDFFADPGVMPVFDLMLAEITKPGLGTQAMAEVLMKQCLIALLRQHLLHDGGDSPLFVALHHPRLARAVLAILDEPAASHSVGSLADLAVAHRSPNTSPARSSRDRSTSCRKSGSASQHVS